MRLLRIFLIFITLFSLDLCAEQKLTLKQIQPTMREILSYHVENNEFSRLVVKRSIKIYIEQFDPDKIYLLREEVDSFLEISDEKADRIISVYQRSDVQESIKLNHIIEQAIKRNQRIRGEVIEEIVSTPALKETYHSPANYANNIFGLKKRFYLRYENLLEKTRRKRGLVELSPETKQKILNLWERKRRLFEKKYLFEKDLDEHHLAIHILKAMSKSLDAHTAFYTADEAFEIRTSLQKQFEGIGVLLKEEYDGIFITDLIEGSPAKLSGNLQVGDRLIAINGSSIIECTFEEVLEKMKGNIGESISLGVSRNDVQYSAVLKREKIVVNEERLTFTYEPYSDGIIGKITLPSFYDNGDRISVERDLKDALKHLKTKGELKGLVIDIRENSGGFLNQAVKVSGMFIPRGVIVISKYSDGEVRYIRDLDGRLYYDGPLVILASKASASAAEIVAQSLQDYGAALIVGDSRTYGKGCMQYQTITDEGAETYYKVTVGRYYTVSGRSTQIEGVQADIVVPTIYSPFNIGERFLDFPLTGDHLGQDITDSLAQLSRGSYKSSFEHIVPYLKPRETTWRQMLADLKKNSHERIEGDRNYQYFLKVINGKAVKSKPRSRRQCIRSNYGIVDIQMKEAVNIVKDMIIKQSQ